MGTYFENFNIEVEDEEFIFGLAKNVIENGRALKTYYGDGGYIDYEYGSLQIILDVQSGEKANEVVSFDTQCATRSIWEVRVGIPSIGINRTEGTRRVTINRRDTGSGMAIVNVVNPDVLPSYAVDEVITLQMAAFPEVINYYPTREAFEDTFEPIESKVEFLNGQKVIPAEGVLFPNGAFIAAKGEKNDTEKYEDIMVFNAVVKDVKKSRVSQTEWFYTIIVDTQFGELTVIHSEKMVDAAQRALIVPGSIINCACHLVGDPALFEFAKGAVFDSENNLKVVRHCCTCGDTDRMRGALSEDAVYERGSDHKTWRGSEEVIERFRYIFIEGDKCRAFLGTIDSTTGGESSFPEGTRCLALMYGDEDVIETLMIVETSEEGKIVKITTVPYNGYHFRFDDQEYYDRLSKGLIPSSDEEMQESNAMKLRKLLMDKVRNNRTMDIGMGLLDGLPREQQEKRAEEIISLIENADSEDEIRRILEPRENSIDFKDLVLCDHNGERVYVNVTADIIDGALTVSGNDVGEAVEDFWSDEDYEYWYKFTPEETARLLKLIGGEQDPQSALLEHFSGERGCSKLREFCDQNKIQYTFDSWA